MSINYKDSGVDVEAGQREVQLIKSIVEQTHDQNVLSKLGGFSGLYDLTNFRDMTHPVLVSGTDGVGTKVMLAQMMDKHDTVGIDCVAMCVNDILCQGAQPLFFLDYIGTGKLIPEKMAEIVKGVSEGCLAAGASLIGGETAEMPGVYEEDEYDIAGFVVGIVDKNQMIDGSQIEEGDLIFGLSSSGIHSNGYSLVRKVVLEKMQFDLNDQIDGFHQPLGEVLLTPTKIYVKEMLSLMEKVEVKVMSHITGGGYYENIPRMIKEGYGARVDVREVEVPQIFKLLQQWANISDEEMYATFNMGIGFVFVVRPEDSEIVEEHFKDYDSLYRVGEIVKGDEKLELQF